MNGYRLHVTSKFSLSPDLLVSAGIRHLTQDQVGLALRELYDVLELRVGLRLARTLSATQLNAFEKLVDSGSEPDQLSWIQNNVSDYREQVQDELEYIERRLSSAMAVARQEIESLVQAKAPDHE